MKPLETTVEEVLRQAILSEIETRVSYLRLSERTSSPAVRARLVQLADMELVHRAKLEKKYRESVGGPPPAFEEPILEVPAEIANLDMSRALKYALERERD